MSFLLAMLIYPDVLAKAQAEIDAYLGPARESYTCRMPAIEDIQELPYISALVKEVWRWNPSVPLGMFESISELLQSKQESPKKFVKLIPMYLRISASPH